MFTYLREIRIRGDGSRTAIIGGYGGEMHVPESVLRRDNHNHIPAVVEAKELYRLSIETTE